MLVCIHSENLCKHSVSLEMIATRAPSMRLRCSGIPNYFLPYGNPKLASLSLAGYYIREADVPVRRPKFSYPRPGKGMKPCLLST